MADHEAPTSWFARWQDAEPIRLYLWSIASALLAGSVATGLLTAEAGVAITGAVSAVLMVGGAAAARRLAYAPATVDRYATTWHDHAADEYRRGVEAGIEVAHRRTPDELAATTSELRALRVQTERNQCREVDESRRCELPRDHEGPHMMPSTA